MVLYMAANNAAHTHTQMFIDKNSLQIRLVKTSGFFDLCIINMTHSTIMEIAAADNTNIESDREDIAKTSSTTLNNRRMDVVSPLFFIYCI